MLDYCEHDKLYNSEPIFINFFLFDEECNYLGRVQRWNLSGRWFLSYLQKKIFLDPCEHNNWDNFQPILMILF